MDVSEDNLIFVLSWIFVGRAAHGVILMLSDVVRCTR